MPSKITTVTGTIMTASWPEDVFGDLPGTRAAQLADIKRYYRELARAIHPDFVPPGDRAAAEKVFARLGRLKDAAEKAILAGTYGARRAISPDRPVVIRSRNRSYAVGDPLASGDIANLYHCTVHPGSAPSGGDGPSTSPLLLKVARNAADNDLIRAEATTLRYLLTPDRPEAKGFFPFLPKITDSFSFRDSTPGPARQANVFDLLPGFYSLEEIRKAYPGGISPRHMAWIWRQLLLVLGYAHTRGVIHGAVLPSHVLIHADHDLMLLDWCYGVRSVDVTKVIGGPEPHIPAISEHYADWYPPEVLASAQPSRATDIYMSARCMAYLMGADGGGQGIPPRVAGYVASCLLKIPDRRPQDAWKLRKDFTTLIEQIWGPRKRILLDMPSQK